MSWYTCEAREKERNSNNNNNNHITKFRLNKPFHTIMYGWILASTVRVFLLLFFYQKTVAAENVTNILQGIYVENI